MSDVDLRMAEAAEDAHSRALMRAEEAIALYESDPHWWPQDASIPEISAFVQAVLAALDGPHDQFRRSVHLARRAAFSTTALRRAGA